ncbi:TFP11-domain-containing protein [Viridothelium virens]|uniref:TFP11-domain-containing protein n=1 Tax=Viridothelium virens TaxID=1048519 RepID=A0A6A6H7C4_VIRVR|nr:TFP11-domain-containing protein [Viridothelium virens]
MACPPRPAWGLIHPSAPPTCSFSSSLQKLPFHASPALHPPSAMPPTTNGFGQKRKADSDDGGPPKKMSFAERMMQKMGHQTGQGLGEHGEGIINPIEVKQRPQGAGLGTVKEKTEQAKSEAKRAAARRGEEYEDSSEEERKARRRRRETARSGAPGGTSTPTSRPRTQYRVAANIQSLADDLGEANVLKSLIDATGTKSKVLTSTAGLMTPNSSTNSFSTTEAEKIALRAQRELEAFANHWNQLKERKEYVTRRQGEVQQEIEEQDHDITRLNDIVNTAERLQEIKLDGFVEEEQMSERWGQLVKQLETIQSEYATDPSSTILEETAVAAIHPLFKRSMDLWDPLSNPDYIVGDLQKLRIILGINSKDSSLDQEEDQLDGYTSQPSSSLYESMMSSSWLPKMRGVVTNEWVVEDSEPLLRLVEAWKPVLPPFVFHRFVDELIFGKLSTNLHSWDPRSSRKRKLPHVWLFPWLQHLGDAHMDLGSAHGLLTEVKSKLKVALKSWDIRRGIMPGLEQWRNLLCEELDKVLRNSLLPRLAHHLLDSFIVDPSDQDLTSLEQVLAWSDHFKPSVIGQVLAAEFFPKWLDALYQWLSLPDPGARLDEVADWFEWWHGYLPADISATTSVTQEWQKGLEMMNSAADLYEAGKVMQDIARPVAGPSRPIAPGPALPSVSGGKTEAQTKARREFEECTFKDAVEEWCSEEGLLFIPMREAQETSGQPLFRMTASASGKGGVLLYLKGDVIWGQNKRDKKSWEPVGIEPEGLPQPLLELAGVS